MQRRFSFHLASLPAPLAVTQLRGREAISELYRYQLVIGSPTTVDLSKLVGHAAVVAIRRDGTVRQIHGVVQQLRELDRGKNHVLLDALLVPRHWLLTQRIDCRIYQEMTVPEIVVAVLEEAGFSQADGDYALRLEGSYPIRHYSVQYRESDWDFINRLLEEEGIIYHFEQADDRATLVLADAPAAHGEVAQPSTIDHRPTMAGGRAGEHVLRFHFCERIRPDRVTLRDYDFTKPGFLLESSVAFNAASALEVYDYPGDYQDPALGDQLARIRLEQWRASSRTAEGKSHCAQFAAGQRFTLNQHETPRYNADYLLTEVEHQGSEPLPGEADDVQTVYENRFECVPAATPYRVERRTPKPAIYGVQSAIVTGSGEIHTDEHGRVKVQFHWDRRGGHDSHSSCWLRVGQIAAGAGFGGIHIPRVGEEVLVSFVDGDPDRPIVVGRVYHGTNRPPFGLPGQKTQSGLKSNSTPGGGGSNELRFEDSAGGEQVYLHAQKDWVIAVENDKSQTIGHDETLSVTHDRSRSIGHDEHTSVANDQSIRIGRDNTLSVGNDRIRTIGRDQTLSVGRDCSRTIGRNDVTNVGRACR